MVHLHTMRMVGLLVEQAMLGLSIREVMHLLLVRDVGLEGVAGLGVALPAIGTVGLVPVVVVGAALRANSVFNPGCVNRGLCSIKPLQVATPSRVIRLP